MQSKVKPQAPPVQVPAISYTRNSANAENQPVRSRNSASGSASIKKADKGPPLGKEPAAANQAALENDTFNKHYNKELRVSKDEIPIVMAELNDSAYRFIKREQYERALNLLQKAYGIMDVIDFKSCRRDKFHLFIMFHNMALCYQKMQMLEECASCIDQALEQMPVETIRLEEKSISNRMRKLCIISRLRMQFCAILSQIHRHKDALEQAHEGVRLSHLLINDLKELALFYIKREDISVSFPNHSAQGNTEYEGDSRNKSHFNSNASNVSKGGKSVNKDQGKNRNRSFSSFLSQQEAYGAFESIQNDGKKVNQSLLSKHNASTSSHNMSSFYSANQLDASMSYIEKTARKLYPILIELKKRMIPEKKRILSTKQRQRDSRGNSVLTIDPNEEDSDEDQLVLDLKTERNPGKSAIDLKNILGYLNQGEWTSKLSIGSIMQLQPIKIKELIEQGQNEMQLTRESFIHKVSSLAVAYFCYSTEIRFIIQMKEDNSFDTPTKQKESEYWHAKSLELACTFLPGECPLLNHINLSYQKHFAPVKTTIDEDHEQDDNLQVIKPLNGVDNNKFQPIIRKLSNVKVSITPYVMTPLHKVTKEMLNQMMSFNEYYENNQSQQHSQGAIGQNILPFSINQPNAHNSSVNQNQSLLEFDNELNHQISTAADDMKKLDILLKHLLDSKKVSKKQLLQKLIQINENKDDPSDDNLLNENILEDSGQDESQIAPLDGSHRQAISNTNSTFYNLRNQDHLHQLQNERPKSSKGGYRSILPTNPTAIQNVSNTLQNRQNAKNSLIGNREQSKTVLESRNDVKLQLQTQQPTADSHANLTGSRQGKRVESVSNLASENLNLKPSKGSKTKKDSRPLSGGVAKMIKGPAEVHKSRVSTAMHNQSMYDKMGGGNLQISPGQLDLQQRSMNKIPANYNSLKPVQNPQQKLAHNSSFDSMPLSNQLSSIQINQPKSSNPVSQIVHNSAQQNSKIQTTIQAQQLANLSQGVGANPQAYDELKKRLLSEYKKLTKQKGNGPIDENRDRLGQVSQAQLQNQGQLPMTKPSSKGNGKKSGSRIHSDNGLSQLNTVNSALVSNVPSNDNSSIGNHLEDPRNDANQAPHMNVYKPTFIVHFCKCPLRLPDYSE